MIPDHTAQDTKLAPRRAVTPARFILGASLIAIVTWTGWHFREAIASNASFSRERLTFATVTLGDLQRDIAAEGRVVAASAPTLYAGSGGTIAFAVEPGSTVKAGQVIATIASAELLANLAQVRSAAEALRSDWLRAEADGRQARAAAEAAVQTAALS